MDFIKDLKTIQLYYTEGEINLYSDVKKYQGKIVYTKDKLGRAYVPSELVSKLEKL